MSSQLDEHLKGEVITEEVLKAGPELTVFSCQPGMLQFLTQQPDKLNLPVQEGGAFVRCGEMCSCGTCGGHFGCRCC
ncbi:hypothetical protein BV898_10529 [Hypsibius exemplaris]|uniref:Uncharacterized protein n=1 Tax=Hypsibius exemplaris TaxID=2072580 RepID=A0A1W0WJA2_HYPEX|nr:hypothetical protein BV898_10529 [Hypsibius exemplaris]